MVSLRGLSPRAARFLWRARWHAIRTGDVFSLDSAMRPAELAVLIALARGRGRVVELGTGTGWSAIALALDDRTRRVITYDPVVRPEREAYLAMVPDSVRDQVELRDERDTAGPRPGDAAELLFPAMSGMRGEDQHVQGVHHLRKLGEGAFGNEREAIAEIEFLRASMQFGAHRA